jgi:opacity protein-like surface antigen
MRRFVPGLALLVMTLAVATSASAQRVRDRGLVELAPEGVRGGFYIGGGFGAGTESYRFADENGWSDGLTKPTFTLRLGGTPSPTVRVGGEIFAWTAETSVGQESFGVLMGTVMVFPVREAGLYLKAGGGFGTSMIRFDNGSENTETGFAWSVGAGYDFQLSKSIGLGPSVELYQASFTSRDEPTLNERVLNIGVQLTFQTGGRQR